jgi:hypothetical protein
LLQVLSAVVECTQQLLHILRVNGPRLEGPLHTGLASGTQSALLQLESHIRGMCTDRLQLLESLAQQPQLPPSTCHVTQLEDLWASNTMTGGVLAVTQHALSSIAANPAFHAASLSSVAGPSQYSKALQQFAGEGPAVSQNSILLALCSSTSLQSIMCRWLQPWPRHAQLALR